MFDKYRLMASVLVRTREDYYKLFPKDTSGYGKLTEVLHSVCWKIKDNEISINGIIS